MCQVQGFTLLDPSRPPQEIPQIRLIKTMGRQKRRFQFRGFGAKCDLLIAPPVGAVEAVPPRMQLQGFENMVQCHADSKFETSLFQILYVVNTPICMQYTCVYV